MRKFLFGILILSIALLIAGCSTTTQDEALNASSKPSSQAVNVSQYITSTTPADGATEVSREITEVVINFSKPMRSSTNISFENYYFDDVIWSTDKKTLTITTTTQLAANTVIRLVINSNKYPDNPMQSEDGEEIPVDTTISFSTTGS